MEITVSHTIQIRPFEPLTVTIKEDEKVETTADYQELRDKIIACVVDTIETARDKMPQGCARS